MEKYLNIDICLKALATVFSEEVYLRILKNMLQLLHDEMICMADHIILLLFFSLSRN